MPLISEEEEYEDNDLGISGMMRRNNVSQSMPDRKSANISGKDDFFNYD